jgi:hypothetical protein
LAKDREEEASLKAKKLKEAIEEAEWNAKRSKEA